LFEREIEQYTSLRVVERSLGDDDDDDIYLRPASYQ
jgi:hypothetical protein